jgi:methionyl-tRNA formyltransferase
MNIIFMGTPEFAVPALRALVQEYNIVGVFTSPPRPKNRGHEVKKSSVHIKAEEMGLPVFTPEKLKTTDQQELFFNLKPEIAIVAAYGLLLPKVILDFPKYGCVNIHGSLLPRWRGAAPIHRALLAGDTETGVGIMQMEEGLDTGPVWAEAKVPIRDTSTTLALYDQLANLGAELLIKTLPQILVGSLKPQHQKEQGVTYAHKITKEDGLIDWNSEGPYIERMCRALNPWPGVWFERKGEIIKVHTVARGCPSLSLAPGSFKLTENGLYVGVGKGETIALKTIQKSGGKPMDSLEFSRGNKLFV